MTQTKAEKISNPYKELPDHCFWSRSHRGNSAVDPVVRAPFKISRTMAISTAGSCFAQHIANRLELSGYRYLVTEKPHPIINSAVARDFGYGVFTARYGNIYTVRQLLQLIKRASGDFVPEEDIWQVPGGFVDPFRPNIQPVPFATEEEFYAARAQHFSAVVNMLLETDVFVFTLGLTEAWMSSRDGAVFPLCPGVSGGEFDTDKHVFHNFTVDEITADFVEFAETFQTWNPNIQFILTVSPVPLIATARADQSVISATCYSKAVLRVAAEQLTTLVPGCHYFPSYEIITGAHARGAYFGSDLRNVDPAGVDHVMSLFMQHYIVDEKPTPTDRTDPRSDTVDMDLANALDAVCDEVLIERSLDE